MKLVSTSTENYNNIHFAADVRLFHGNCFHFLFTGSELSNLKMISDEVMVTILRNSLVRVVMDYATQ